MTKERLEDLEKKNQWPSRLSTAAIGELIEAIRQRDEQIDASEKALREIADFDNDPSNHHRDASKCSVCVAKKYFGESET